MSPVGEGGRLKRSTWRLWPRRLQKWSQCLQKWSRLKKKKSLITPPLLLISYLLNRNFTAKLPFKQLLQAQFEEEWQLICACKCKWSYLAKLASYCTKRKNPVSMQNFPMVYKTLFLGSVYLIPRAVESQLQQAVFQLCTVILRSTLSCTRYWCNLKNG